MLSFVIDTLMSQQAMNQPVRRPGPGAAPQGPANVPVNRPQIPGAIPVPGAPGAAPGARPMIQPGQHQRVTLYPTVPAPAPGMAQGQGQAPVAGAGMSMGAGPMPGSPSKLGMVQGQGAVCGVLGLRCVILSDPNGRSHAHLPFYPRIRVSLTPQTGRQQQPIALSPVKRSYVDKVRMHV